MHRKDTRRTEITYDDLFVLQDRFDLSIDHDLMLFAALCTNVCALLRRSELLGSSDYQERVITYSRIHWFSDSNADHPMVWAPAVPSPPKCFSIDLGISKTDQLGNKGLTAWVGADLAVTALWRWWCKLPHPCAADQLVFISSSGAALKHQQLERQVQQRVDRAPSMNIRVTGKSWRQGGASSLAAHAESQASVNAAGHWTSNSNASNVYVQHSAKKRLALAASYRMDRRPQLHQ